MENLIPEDLAGKTVVDIGPGYGYWGFMLKMYRTNPPEKLIGIEILPENIERLHRLNLYDEIIHADCREEFKAWTPKSVDITIMSHVIEHMEKEDGEDLLEALADLARELVVVICPEGDTLFERDFTGGSHLSIWRERCFKKHGYETHHHRWATRAGRATVLFERLWFWLRRVPRGGNVVAWCRPSSVYTRKEYARLVRRLVDVGHLDPSTLDELPRVDPLLEEVLQS